MMLPPNHTPWIYYESAGPDFEGFQGFFANSAEVDHFAEGLAKVQKTTDAAEKDKARVNGHTKTFNHRVPSSSPEQLTIDTGSSP